VAMAAATVARHVLSYSGYSSAAQRGSARYTQEEEEGRGEGTLARISSRGSGVAALSSVFPACFARRMQNRPAGYAKPHTARHAPTCQRVMAGEEAEEKNQQCGVAEWLPRTPGVIQACPCQQRDMAEPERQRRIR